MTLNRRNFIAASAALASAPALGAVSAPGETDVAIVGAGAAGLAAAIHAGGAGVPVVVLESTGDGGRKILISGGGRCNILPSADDAPRRFVTDSSPNTLRKMLRSWPLREQISFFERDAGLVLAEEKETGKLFPASNRARDVRDALFALARRRNVRLLTNTLVTGLAPIGRRWSVQREGAPDLEADAVIVATGGLSVPKSGSDGLGLSLLAALGHSLHATYPALTPPLAPPNRRRAPHAPSNDL